MRMKRGCIGCMRRWATDGPASLSSLKEGNYCSTQKRQRHQESPFLSLSPQHPQDQQNNLRESAPPPQRAQDVHHLQDHLHL